MKKNLRMLFLGLAAAAFTGGIAQEAKDLTSLLKNPTMEKGVRGWSVDGQKPLGPGNKNTGTSHFGYHGMSKAVFEAWNGDKKVDGTGENGIPAKWYRPALPDGYIMQRLGGLENGTYVFGAYAGASLQTDSLPDSYKNITGVSLFANNAEVAVATNNPESKGLPQWAHTGKYNVAVTLTDQDERKGYLDMGLRIEGTNANFVIWDNATLYYFGNMSEEQALDAMAKIDFRHSVYDIADTLFTKAALDTLVLHQDTLANFLQVLEDSKKAIDENRVTAANLWELNEVLYHNKGLAHKSIQDYTYLKNSIKAAQKLIDERDLWVTGDVGEEFFPGLEEAVAAANEAYEAREMNRKELEDLRKWVNYSAGYVKLDSVLVAKEELGAFITEAKKEGAPYTAVQVSKLEQLQLELGDTIDAISADMELEEPKINPNNLYPYVAKIHNAINDMLENQVSAEYTVFPIVFEANENGVGFVGSKNNADGWLSYTSPMYTFKNEVTIFRMKMAGSKESNTGNKYFTLSTLAFYNEDGVRYSTENGTVNHDKVTGITTFETEDFTLATNASHNELGGDDGNGMAGLMDADKTTWYHSDYNGKHGGEDPYFEVTFKKGIKRLQFEMVARDGGRANQFPNGMTIGLPTPERDAMEAKIETLKNLRAYSVHQVNEVGFYNTNFKNILDVIAEAEELLASDPAETDCAAMSIRLSQALNEFTNAVDKSVSLPVEGEQYWLVSALPGFNANQQLDKALTFHAADSTLWWETAGVDSLKQMFTFTPVLVDEEPAVETDANGQPLYYLYFMKHVNSKLYVSRTFTDTDKDGDKRVKLVENPDTIRLKSLGAGQWQLTIWKKKDGKMVLEGMDMYDNKGGVKGDKPGDYGDKNSIAGVTCHVGPWAGGYNSGSSFFIRQFSALPLKVAVKEGEVKTQCYHFAPGNNIKLTANAECDFENANVKLYNLFGEPIAVDTVMYYGNTAHFITPKAIVECGFGFTAPAGVTEVFLTTSQYVSKLPELVAAYEAAVEAAPIVGDSIGTCKDDTKYLAVLKAAEELIAAVPTMPENDATNKEIEAMVNRLQKASDLLEYNLPEEGKYYYIVNALSAFEKKNYEMTMYADGARMAWGGINDVDWCRYWQFERATKAELAAKQYPDTIDAFFIKNLGTQEYVGGFATQNKELGSWVTDSDIPMAPNKTEALPYVVTPLGNGSIIALDAWDFDSKSFRSRLHAKGHSNGDGRTGGITYWGSGLESSSAWRIVEVEYDVTDIDFTEVETEAPVVKGIYDIFGRRVVAPTAPGLYIIDGKKRYIK